MKDKLSISLLIMILCLTVYVHACAQIAPFSYSFATPTTDDLTQADAEMIADEYFSRRSDRILIHHQDIQQYEKVTHFVRIVRNNEPLYCWVIAYNDSNSMWSRYGFVGIVIVSSPDGRIIDYSDDLYYQCFAAWISSMISPQCSSAEAYGALDLIVLPEQNRVKHIVPDLYVITEAEAISIGDRLISGYQHISENDIEIYFDKIVSLERDLLISDFPVWKIVYRKYGDEHAEGGTKLVQEYTVAIYAHTGKVWYVIDHSSNQVLYADHSFCKYPLTEELFDAVEWELGGWKLLFGPQ